MLTFCLSELFAAISSALGMLLMILIFTKRKGKNSIQISLVFLILILILIVILGGLNYSGKIKMFPHLLRVDSPIHYLLAPAAFIYTLSSLKRNFRFKSIYLLLLVPFLLNIIQFMPLYLSSAATKLNYYYDYKLFTNGSMILQKQHLLKVTFGSCFVIAQCYLLYKFLVQNSTNEKYNLSVVRWFSVYIGIQIACYSIVIFDIFNNMQTFSDPYKFSMNMTSLLLFSISTALFFFPRLLYGAKFSENPNTKKYSNSNLTEENKELILSKWVLFIDDSSKPYLNPKLQISEIATQLNTNSQRLSQVINEKTGVNFNDTINYLRIEEAKQLLTSDSLNKHTIDAIAQKSGFNSKSPFYTAFKKYTGLTPKEFIISIKKD